MSSRSFSKKKRGSRVLLLLIIAIVLFLFTKKITSRPNLRETILETSAGQGVAASLMSVKYPATHELLTSLSGHTAELATLLGAETKQTYLVALMNTSEKKPDGGFFGSFALLSLDPHSYQVEFFDSYHPQTRQQVSRPLPAWFDHVLGIESIGFLGANMLGFTSSDGQNILEIYNQTYGTELDGVILVKYDLFREILPDFDSLSYKREFLNATVDLIRGEYTGNKKEYYFEDVQDMVSGKAFLQMGEQLLAHLPTLLDKGYIRVHMPQISPELRERFAAHHLINDYQPQTIYAYDYNLGFNKIDKFVTKTMSLSRDGEPLQEEIGEQMTLDVWESGVYDLFIYYDLAVPTSYLRYIDDLTKHYQLTLSDREKTILSLDAQRDNRGVVYLPKQSQNITIDGQIIEKNTFQTPFAQGVVYESVGKGRKLQREVHIRFVLP